MLAQSIPLRPPSGLRLYSFQRDHAAKTVSRGRAMMSNVAANPGLSNLAHSGNDKAVSAVRPIDPCSAEHGPLGDGIATS
jgi:hypothetical protein